MKIKAFAIGLIIFGVSELAFGAWLFHFTPIQKIDGYPNAFWVWDRWSNRPCLAAFGSTPTCGLVAQPKVAISHPDGSAAIISAVRGAALPKMMPHPANFVASAKENGFSDGEIALYVFWLVAQFKAAGFTPANIDAYCSPILKALEMDAIGTH